MYTERSHHREAVAFVVVTLLELPMLATLAATIAPEADLPVTAVLMVIAVVLNWAVLHHFGRML